MKVRRDRPSHGTIRCTVSKEHENVRLMFPLIRRPGMNFGGVTITITEVLSQRLNYGIKEIFYLIDRRSFFHHIARRGHTVAA